MSSGKQFIRQWRLLKLLDANDAGLTVDDMLRGLELVSTATPHNEREAARRTLYRDIKVLQNSGFPILPEKHEGKTFYFIIKDFQPKVPQQDYTLTELISIYFARELLLNLKTPFADGIETFYGKLRDSLPDKAFEFLDELARVLVVNDKGFKDYRRHARLLEDIRKGIEYGQRLEILHTAIEHDKPVAHLFDPYITLYNNGALYLYGYSHRAKAERMFKIDRIEKLSLTEEIFDRPANFDIKKRLKPAFGLILDGKRPATVKVRLNKIAAKIIGESVIHPSQRLSKNKDGTSTLTMKVSGLEEMKYWLLWLGSQATVLEPKSLRDEMISELDAARRNYQG